jgi:vacuolar-type H+-ATPase subunit E/Vma4
MIDDITREKIEQFKFSCEKLTKNDYETIMQNINNQIENNTAEELKEYENELNEKYMKKVKKIELNYNTKIFRINNEARYKIIEKENNAKEEIRKEVLSKVKEYTKNSEYMDFLIKNINQSLENLNISENDEIHIYITDNDKQKYEKYISKNIRINTTSKNTPIDIFTKSHSRVKFEILDDKNIGGSKCINFTKKIEIDNTLSTLIDENFQIEEDE